MMYEVKNEKLQIKVKGLGAELTSLKDLTDDTEYLWQGNPEYWKGQSPILFPIIGGLPGGQYELDGKIYSMNGHGFAKISEFEVLEQKEQQLTLLLRYNEETLQQYPFQFELRVTHILEGNAMRVRFEVENLDTREMLFSVGAHPAFKCPIHEGENMEDYSIVFEKKETLQRRLKVGGLLSGEKVDFLKEEDRFDLKHSLFYEGAIILKGYESSWVEIRNTKNPKVIRVEFGGFPDLGIWSAKNDGPFVCIEPWYGVDSTQGDPVAFTRKEGLVRLGAGRTFECEYRVVVE